MGVPCRCQRQWAAPPFLLTWTPEEGSLVPEERAIETAPPAPLRPGQEEGLGGGGALGRPAQRPGHLHIRPSSLWEKRGSESSRMNEAPGRDGDGEGWGRAEPGQSPPWGSQGPKRTSSFFQRGQEKRQSLCPMRMWLEKRARADNRTDSPHSWLQAPAPATQPHLTLARGKLPAAPALLWMLCQGE